MKLFIVLQIKPLKKPIKILIYLIIFCPLIICGQSYDSTKIDYNFIDSYPQNASVTMNETFIGNTPLFFQYGDSTFPKSLKITLKGYIEQSEVINSNELINMKYILIPNSSRRNELNVVKEDKLPYFKEPRKVVPIVVSSIITAASGIGAFYFKSLASDNRKHYETFGDNESLDNKKKYDLLGGVSLVALQLGFGALMYFLFLD